MSKQRCFSLERNTNETKINMELNLDGSGIYSINTGIGFLDHMLTLTAKHGFMDIKLNAQGDLDVDCHHTVEDTGIVMGKCIDGALGSREKIKRYAFSYVPMDEALAFVCIDISGRPYLVFDAPFTSENVGGLQVEMVEEFFRAVAFNSGITFHAKVLYGKNNHHMIEALFKAFGRALNEAASIDKNIKGVLSTKGII